MDQVALQGGPGAFPGAPRVLTAQVAPDNAVLASQPVRVLFNLSVGDVADMDVEDGAMLGAVCPSCSVSTVLRGFLI